MRYLKTENDYLQYIEEVNGNILQSAAFPFGSVYFRLKDGHKLFFYLGTSNEPYKKEIFNLDFPIRLNGELYRDYADAEEALSELFGSPSKEIKEKVEEIENNLNDTITNLENVTETVEDLSEEVVTLNEGLQSKADKDSVYTQNEVDLRLNLKVDTSTLENQYFDKDAVDELLSTKADADNVYSKTESDELLSAKADANNVYSKSETDEKLDEKANTVEVDAINDNIEQILDDLGTKQDVLVDGENIKTVQNQSILGSGNIELFSMMNQADYDAIVEMGEVDNNKLYLIPDNKRIYFKGHLIIDNSTPTPPTPPTPTGTLCMTVYSDADTFEIYRNEGETLKQALARYIAENVGEEGTNVVRVWQKSINRVVFDDSITEMNESPFDQMNGMYNNITEMVLPSDLETIGNYGFEHVSVTNWTIPSSVNSIGRYAFVGCYDGENPIRRTFNFLSETPPSMNDYTIFSQDVICDEENGKFDDYEYVTIKVPNCEAVNAYKEFFNSKGTQWQRLVDRVFTDDECDEPEPTGDIYASFYYNDDVSEEQKVDMILEDGQSPKDWLQNWLQNHIYDIRDAGLRIRRVEYGSNVTTIDGVFGYGVFAASNYVYIICTDGEDSWCNGHKALNTITAVTLPSNLTTIGNYAFKGMNAVQTWNIPSSVASIGKQAFARGGEGGSTVEIDRAFYFDGEIPTIGTNVFDIFDWETDEYSYDPRTTLYIGSCNKDAWMDAFYNLEGNYSQYSDNGKIQNNPNDDCGGVEPTGETEEHLALTLYTSSPDDPDGAESYEVYQNDGETVKQALTRFLSDRYEGDTASADNFKRTITHVVFDNSVTEISGVWLFGYGNGSSDDIYDSGWRNIVSVTLPSNLQTIGHDAFADMPKVERWDIPSTVTSIGYMAFQRDDRREKVYRTIRFNSTQPPTLGNNVFDITEGSTYVADTNQRIEAPIDCEVGEDVYSTYFAEKGGTYQEYVDEHILAVDECM